MTKVQPWAWVVLTASFSSMFFNSSFFAVGVIHVALLEKYPDVEVSTIAWIGSVFSCMFALSGFLGSFIINISNVRTCVMLSGLLALVGFATSSIVTDHRILFITYGIIAGIGPAMSMAGSLVVIGYYFGPKTSMATGIATSGCALCTFIFPPLTQYCVDTYGLGGAFLILGGLGFQSAVCGALMRPTKYEIRSKKKSKCCTSTSQPKIFACFLKRNVILFTSPSFWLLLICSFSFHVALSCVYLYLPDYLNHQGSSHQEAAIVLSITGVTGILSRILLGFLASNVDASLVLGSTLGIMGIITFFIKYMKTIGSKITYTTLLGFYTGGSWALQYTLLVEIVGLYQQSTAYGVMMHISGIGYMVGPPFAGK
ncbi:hypothetical protein LOTGIDRAFT_225181 [Lottia gigantea]|uniref:Major facilitator superfamily (MFS) profile domain-containing protein n=1 Tax=Lottia gigantea TaxID=225164 RepID=V4B6J5_LOTGI|nr:hypothetical protein LOTGIDRAFT_225181 [Lottia gigantea]ESP01707.1 hypothetical protein LOTGIDRAFT_225181 [Lottia gigantea]